MTTWKWFGQREEPKTADVYIYDDLPPEARGRIRFAVKDALKRVQVHHFSGDTYEVVYHLLCRAFGGYVTPAGERGIESFLMNCSPRDFFRALEVVFAGVASIGIRLQDGLIMEEWTGLRNDINKLLGDYHLGYRVEALQSPREDEPLLQVIRIDSAFEHKEIVKPALDLLQREDFKTASEQFSNALIEYSERNFSDAITDAGSAFEAVLKRVLNRTEGNASQLIKEAGGKGYFPSYLEDSVVHFDKILLALPVVRNKEGDVHGRIQKSKESEDLARLARYAIHLSAANIIFIIDRYNRRGNRR